MSERFFWTYQKPLIEFGMMWFNVLAKVSRYMWKLIRADTCIPKWSTPKSGSQWSILTWSHILEFLSFLVCINDLLKGLTKNAKPFSDDTSLFSVVRDSAASSMYFNDDLQKMSGWTYQWEMIFDPDASKQAQEIVFSCKISTPNHITIFFNNAPVIRGNI